METQPPETPSDAEAGQSEAARDAAGISTTDTTAPSAAPQNDPILVVKPGPPAAATPPATNDAANTDRMDAPAFKELAQMVGAMVFVGLLTAAGWHAAHYSGAWPY
ncbi:hypothetical protein LWC05_15240 [Acetobacter sicerae]|uniref:Uncharacterized protein n=1 Tax=Acetobacter sicerae TaxID=85325 RepID=A0ABS8VY61_9PROT|nr:hypothetical protein [Acetobacter sicerae]MCE0745229.1 hypothetical protein [Acetobacter sicerae]NHN91990.1 hypothetical protein [Acetobacter sicerae]